MSHQFRAPSRRRLRHSSASAEHDPAAGANDDDFHPLLSSLDDDHQAGMDYRRHPPPSRKMRPMNVSPSKDFKSSGTITEGDSESSEEVPLLQHPTSLMDRTTFLGVEDQTYPSTRTQISRGRRHRRQRVNAWDQGASGHILLNSSPIKDVGCCHSGCCCVQCIRTGEVGLLQIFGRFERILPPGFVCMCWPCYRVGRVSLRVQQADVKLESKTKDAVFVSIGLSVQYQVMRSDAFQAYYSLTDPEKQIVALVYDVVRSKVPQLDVDELFTSNSILANAVSAKLDFMQRYGYKIVNTLVTSMTPVESVRRSMNEINASKRLKDAAPFRAEGEKIARVKEAEAFAEKSYLDGVGVAKARIAIATSMKESLLKLDVKESLRPKHIMDLLLVSQYMDTLSAVGANSIIVKSSPDEIPILKSEIAKYFASTVVADTENESPDPLLNLL